MIALLPGPFFKIEKNLRSRPVVWKEGSCSSASITKNSTIAWLEAMMAANVSREGGKESFRWYRVRVKNTFDTTKVTDNRKIDDDLNMDVS